MMSGRSQEDCLVELTGAMIALGRAVEGNKNKPDAAAHNALLSAMYLMIPGTGLGSQQRDAVLRQLREVKKKLVPRCSTCKRQCGRNDEFSVYELGELDPNTTRAKEALLTEVLAFEPLLRGMDETPLYNETLSCLYDALFHIGKECDRSELAPVFQKLYRHKAALMDSIQVKGFFEG